MNREAFEASYASSHDLPLETFSQYRMGDTYRLPAIASHWRTWQMAIESVVVQLPRPATQKGREYVAACGAHIASQGLKVSK
ncbi:hypothetical protein D9M71_598740 [compost metagenome]